MRLRPRQCGEFSLITHEAKWQPAEEEIGCESHSATTRIRAPPPPELIDLNDALEKLTKIDEEKAEVAKLRLFGGLTVTEIAATLDISGATVKRRWSYVKAWLSRELKRDDTNAEES